MPKRMRFSRLPPYSSVRSLIDGDQNWSTRWPWAAEISQPSSPPCLARRAASANAFTTRRMSFLSIARGTVRDAGSRRGEDEIVGNQFSVSHLVRRPIWVSWIISLAPWAWTRSVNCSKYGMTLSSATEICAQGAAGLSMATEDEPPNMVRPMPPLAFSA